MDWINFWPGACRLHSYRAFLLSFTATFCFILSSSGLSAQNNLFELAVRPGIQMAWSSSGSESQNMDSINSMNRATVALSFGALVNIPFGTNLILQTGLSYDNFIVRRYREDLQFLDVVHPQVGQIFDLSVGATKNVRYDYRHRMLGIPMNIMYNITPTKRRNQYEQFVYGGITPQLLISDKLRIDMEGFGIKGKGEYIVQDSLRQSRDFNLSLQAGFRHQLYLDQGTWISIQPGIMLPLLSLSKSPFRDHLIVPFVHIGINFKV